MGIRHEFEPDLLFLLRMLYGDRTQLSRRRFQSDSEFEPKMFLSPKQGFFLKDFKSWNGLL